MLRAYRLVVLFSLYQIRSFNNDTSVLCVCAF
jgi:hypothetical protein